VTVAAWLLCASALSAQTVTVTGSVTNAITHDPIEAVSVNLIRNGNFSGSNTDASGRFRIQNVQPGEYLLRPSRGGFDGVAVEIRIEAGVDPRPFDLMMVPWPRVRGKVLDPERQPLAGVRVRAVNPGNAPGAVYEATTDVAGRFTLEHLMPGRYHFLATPPVTGSATGPTELTPTWFPDVVTQHAAPAVTLAAGDDFAGYDITLRSAPVFRVSGRVVDESGEPVGGATVATGLANRAATTRDDGTFDLARVRPGEDVVRVELRRGEVRLRGFAKIAVGRHDMEGVTVRVAAPVAFSGEVALDGQAGHPCEGEAILMPVDGEGERARAEFSEKGIRFESVYPGRYRLMVLPGWTWSRHYLDSVRMGDRDLTRDEFEVVRGTIPFRVALRTDGGRMRGAVENGNGGLLVLIPRDERLRVRPFIVVVPIQAGAFAIDNVRPGDYFAFTLSDSFNADEMQNPEYARPYLAVATDVRLERGSTVTLSLRYVSPAPH
jgi:hypothetical protein